MSYPNRQIELERMFITEEQYIKYLIKLCSLEDYVTSEMSTF
jgi:hypothetical protein